MERTVFEKIIAGEIPADLVHDDAQCVAFKDVAPQAPVHLLVVPKRRIDRVGEATGEDAALLGHLPFIAGQLGKAHGPGGFRIVVNHGPEGGESVPHLHVHVLAGRPLAWPPG